MSALTATCAGCGATIPYEAGVAKGDPLRADYVPTCYGEWLSAWLGITYVRTCWDRSCVLAARRRLGDPEGPPARRMKPPEEASPAVRG